MEEINDPQGRLANLIEEKRLWEALTSQRAWIKLINVLQIQTDELQRVIIYNPLKSHDEAYAQEFRKGQLEGRLSISTTVETLIADLDFEIERLKEQLDDRPTSPAGFRNAP